MKLRYKPAVLVPLFWWLLAELAGYAAGWYTGCGGGWTELCRSRWDSALYLDIAQQGHTLFECPNLPGKWCGNAGWAPLYPLLMAILGKTGLPLPVAGMAISQLFYFLLLLLSAKMIGVRDYSVKGLLGVGMAAFAPGSIYFQVIFPSSMVVFFLTLSFYMTTQQRYSIAGISAFFAVISYSIGFILIGVLGLWLILEWLEKGVFPKKQVLFLLIPPTFGMGLWFLYDYFVTGHWDALFLIQGKYGHGLNSPLKMLGLHLDNLIKTRFTLEIWIEIQNLMITAIVLAAIVLAVMNRRSSQQRLQGIWMGLFWLFPFSVSMQVSLYRNCGTLLPGWLAFSGIRMRAALLALFILIWWPLAELFFQSRII